MYISVRYSHMERVTGLGPVIRPWQGRVLPLYYTRKFTDGFRDNNLIHSCILILRRVLE